MIDDFLDTLQGTPKKQSTAATAAPGGSASTGFDPSRSYGTPAKLLDNLLNTESSGNNLAVNASTGAMGPYQFTPQTLASLRNQGVKFDPFDQQQARNAADYYIQQLAAKNGGDINKALASYGGFVTKDPSAYVGKVMNGVQANASQEKPVAGNQSSMADFLDIIGNHSDNAAATQPQLQPQNTSVPIPEQNTAYTPQNLPISTPNTLTSTLAGAGSAFGKTLLAGQQLIGKGISAVGNLIGSENTPPSQQNILQNIGGFLNDDAIQGANKLNAENQPYEANNPVSNTVGQIGGMVASPINKLIPGLGGPAASVMGAAGKGLVQGAVQNTLTTPATDENQSFLSQKLQQAGIGAAGGGVGGALAHGILSKTANYLNPLLSKIDAGDTKQAAENIVLKSLEGKNIGPISPELFSSLKQQAKDALDHGNQIDPDALARLAQAQSLPVPVPMLQGQITRNAMQFAKEQNLRGIQGVGEPITQLLQDQNKALIGNFDAIGAKDALDPITSGQNVINALKDADKNLQSKVTDAYQAFKNSTGKSMDVPLQGLAQDYANTLNTFGDAIPKSVQNQFESLGLMSGTTQKVFSIESAENLIKTINANYDPSNLVAAKALGQLRSSVQNAITEGAGSNATGAEAQALAQNARSLAKSRFDLIDSTPALDAAISGVQPDKFIAKYVLNGNVNDINNMVGVLQKQDPGSLSQLQGSILKTIKNDAIKNRSENNGIFSENVLNNYVNDPNMSARLTPVLGSRKMQILHNLKDVTENALFAPKASAINSSNTASAAGNLIKNEVQGGATNTLIQGINMIPGISPLMSPVTRPIQQFVQGQRAANMINESVNPSISQPSLLNPLLQRLQNASDVTGTRIGSAYLKTVNQKNRQ